MRFIAENTDIPIPKLHCNFEDDGAVYLIMEYVEGTTTDWLSTDERSVVEEELEKHIQTLCTLKFSDIGRPSGLVVPPYRITKKSPRDEWDLWQSTSEGYVFCHNDLSMPNVIVDPVTLKDRAIIDREYTGFYPGHFECPFYKRLGRSLALGDEVDDAERLMPFLKSQLVCMPLSCEVCQITDNRRRQRRGNKG